MKNWNIYEQNDPFKFGKFKGQDIEFISENESTYITWCVRNIPNFLISEGDFIHYAGDYNQYDLELLNKKWEEFSLDEQEKEEELELDFSHYDSDYEYSSIDSNPYYNDNLDMDQQDQEFWDSL